MNPVFPRLLQNEFSFDRLFCDVIASDYFSIFYNRNFSEDAIFNHTSFSSSVLSAKNYDSSETIDTFKEINSKTMELGVPSTLYVERFWENARRLEQDAIEFGFIITEQMHILTKRPRENLQSMEDPAVRPLETEDIDLWNSAFVKSFQIPEGWIPELKRRLCSLVNDHNTGLIIAIEDEAPAASGCLLYTIDPPACTGIYCVGTIPERRSHGVAKSMMDYAENIAVRRGCEIMVLQTLARDGVTPMYLKMGFETAFERDVLQFGL